MMLLFILISAVMGFGIAEIRKEQRFHGSVYTATVFLLLREWQRFAGVSEIFEAAIVSLATVSFFGFFVWVYENFMRAEDEPL